MGRSRGTVKNPNPLREPKSRDPFRGSKSGGIVRLNGLILTDFLDLRWIRLQVVLKRC
jgi:hypothetical protein